MIEIIRQEDAEQGVRARELPKDIKQIGTPDIGDRIYVEDGVYRALHPCDSLEEKRAYVLLGKIENCSGRQCVFVEAEIPLPEMEFDGELPLWNDHTWAYIYKQLKREYDSMVIVGWAMDIKGQLPNMTARLENLHQNNFGGTHQLLFLMDSLEREEAFYANRNGHLYRRDGFYIYYDKGKAKVCDKSHYAVDLTQADVDTWKAKTGFEGSIRIEEGASGEADVRTKTEEMSFEERMRMDEPAPARNGTGFEEHKHEEELTSRSLFNNLGFAGEHRGIYRKQVTEQEETKHIPNYASTLLLAMVVCALGVTAYFNHEKMAAMEETLAQMRQAQAISTEQKETNQADGTESAEEKPAVEVETVAGNVQKQDGAENAASGTDIVEGASNPGVNQTQATSADGAAETVQSGVGENISDTGEQTAQMSTGTAGAAGVTAQADGTSAGTGTETAQTADTTSTMTEAQTYLSQGYYVVQKGDSLVGICRKIYQTTAMLDKLCEVNGIEDQDSIYAGQYLTLPN